MVKYHSHSDPPNRPANFEYLIPNVERISNVLILKFKIGNSLEIENSTFEISFYHLAPYFWLAKRKSTFRPEKKDTRS